MKVQDVMTTPVRTVRPSVSLKEVASILTEHGISGLPVVDDGEALLGVISEGDILFKEGGATARRGALGWLLDPYGAEAQLKLAARTAVEAMTAPAVTIGPKQTVAQAARMMIDEGVNRLPVVDDSGTLIGIVTRADLVRAFIRSDTAIAEEIREDVVLRTLWIVPDTLAVRVDHGEVELAGTVETKDDAELLERFTSRVPGVVSVESKLHWQSENGR
jgi:CBS domain-containing protein